MNAGYQTISCESRVHLLKWPLNNIDVWNLNKVKIKDLKKGEYTVFCSFKLIE